MVTLDYLLNNLTEVTHIFKTDRVGESVDNGYGVDFEVAEYAVFTTRTGRKEVHELELSYWEEHHELLNIMTFTNVKNIEELSENIKSVDGYELIWSKDD